MDSTLLPRHEKDKDPYILIVSICIEAIQENNFRNLHQSYKSMYEYIFLFWELILQVYINL